ASRVAVTPEAVAIVRIADGTTFEGTPPSEIPIHLLIYRTRPDVGAIVHFHALYATSLSVAGKPLVTAFNAGAPFGREVPVFDDPRLVRSEDQGRRLAAVVGRGPAALLRGHGAARGALPILSCVMASQTDAEREIEESRESYREWLAGPESFLAAVARHELPIGSALRIGVKGDVDLPDAGTLLTVAASDDGFRVDGFKRGPGVIRLGRYRLRLSHQNAPAVVVIDPEAARAPLSPRWYPYDPRFRFALALEPDPVRIMLGSTRERDRRAERVGWISFEVDDEACRLAVTRLVEPGVPADSYQVFFRDRTSGDETYALGRYLDLEDAEDGRYVVDFNRAYNPACAFSPHYNCPLPPEENDLPAAIAAGEMTPR